VEQRHFSLGAQAAECRLQLQGLVQGLPHEALDQRLSPRAQGSSPKTSGKPLHSGEAYPKHLLSITVEHSDAGISQNAGDLRHLVALVVMVSQDSNDGHRSRAQGLGHLSRFVRISPVGQVTAECEDIGMVSHLADENLERRLQTLPAEVNVSHRSNADRAACLCHCGPIQCRDRVPAVTRATTASARAA
jgi:hypothetical protein